MSDFLHRSEVAELGYGHPISRAAGRFFDAVPQWIYVPESVFIPSEILCSSPAKLNKSLQAQLGDGWIFLPGLNSGSLVGGPLMESCESPNENTIDLFDAEGYYSFVSIETDTDRCEECSEDDEPCNGCREASQFIAWSIVYHAPKMIDLTDESVREFNDPRVRITGDHLPVPYGHLNTEEMIEIRGYAMARDEYFIMHEPVSQRAVCGLCGNNFKLLTDYTEENEIKWITTGHAGTVSRYISPARDGICIVHW